MARHIPRKGKRLVLKSRRLSRTPSYSKFYEPLLIFFRLQTAVHAGCFRYVAISVAFPRTSPYQPQRSRYPVVIWGVSKQLSAIIILAVYSHINCLFMGFMYMCAKYGASATIKYTAPANTFRYHKLCRNPCKNLSWLQIPQPPQCAEGKEIRTI
jgi:hypothetical protein